LIESLAEQRTLARRLHTTRTTTALLQALQAIHAGLRQATTAVAAGKLATAAGHLYDVNTRVTALEPATVASGAAPASDDAVPPAGATCDLHIFTALRGELRRMRAQLKTQLDDLWRAALVVVDNTNNSPAQVHTRGEPFVNWTGKFKQ
jgi:hypothetical protein